MYFLGNISDKERGQVSHWRSYVIKKSVAHPASYAIGTGSFPGVKRPGRGDDHSPNLAPRLKKV